MTKKFKVKIDKTPQSIVDAIRFFELEFGEDYLEYNDIFGDCREIMEFAHEKRHISKEKYNNWLKDWHGNLFRLKETFQVIFGDNEEWEPFCITYEDSKSEDDYDTQYEKALLVYGELICSKEDYFDRFVEDFAKGDGHRDYIQVMKMGM